MQGRGTIVIALGLAAAAVVMMAAYINGRERSLLQLAEMKDVVVATQDLLPNTVIDERVVQRLQVPAKFLQPKAVTDYPEVVGRVVAVPVAKGAQILGTFLQDPRIASLAHDIPRGKRAITIAVNDVTGVGGLVRPGSYVDVLGTFEFGRPVGQENGEVRYADERTEVRVLLQNVPVVAVGTDFEPNRDALLVPGESAPATQGEQATGRAEARTGREEMGGNVTVVVSPAEARDLVLAQQIGVVSLVLRTNLDTADVPLEMQDQLGLLKVQVPVKSRAKPVWREVRGAGPF